MGTSQPRRSPEVEAIITRFFEAWGNHDGETIERLTPPSPEFRAIGTDPTEWWDGTTFTPVMRAQLEEMADFRFEVSHIEAFESGPVSWVAARVQAISERAQIPNMRVTAVLVLDTGVWRIAQWHASEGVTNEESLGFSLTTTLTEILDTLDLDEDLGALFSEGMLTLMFTDVEGSTRHAQELGDHTFTRLMADHIALVRGHAERAGGQVIKTVGDGALLAFSSVRAGVGCAIQIQRDTVAGDLPYAIRIGLHAGDVIRTDADVMGFAVNKAARVTSAASGGQIVVSSVVAELAAGGAFTFGDPFLAELRGIDGVHELVPVEWAAERAEVQRAEEGLVVDAD